MRPLWTYADILKAAGGTGPSDGEVFGIAIDSRETNPGDLFVALKGAETDGHDYVAMAFAMGANAVLVSRKPKNIDKADPRLIWVKDTTKALWNLAKTARKRMAGKVIAVTGSAGKTGTKDAIFAALNRRWDAHTSIRSFNNQVGVPLSLARMPHDTKFGVFEVGMNAPGDIAPLSKLLQPHGAVITNVGTAHAGFFKTPKDIAREKAAIFVGLQKDGFAILNRDNEHFDYLEGLAKKAGVKKTLSFSAESRDADAHVLKTSRHDRCSCLTAQIQDRTVTYKIAMPGHHWIMNSLAVLLSIRAVNGDLGLAGLTLASLAPQPGRGDIRAIEGTRGSFTLMDDSYNANPASMRAALDVLAKIEPTVQGGRKIAVLGDMEELGKFAPEEHLALANDIKAAGVTLLYVRGKNMEALLQSLGDDVTGFAFSENTGISQKLIQDLRSGDVVLIKGSRTAALEDVVDDLNALGKTEDVSGWGHPLEAA